MGNRPANAPAHMPPYYKTPYKAVYKCGGYWDGVARRIKIFFPIDISADIGAAFFCGFFGKLTKPAPHLRLRILRVFAAPPLRPLPDTPQWRNNRFGTSGFRPRLPESCAGAKTLGGSQGNAGESAFSNSNGVARNAERLAECPRGRSPQGAV